MKKDVLQLIKEAARNKLHILDLSNNQLTSLPPEIEQLTNLTELDLSNNQITSLPQEIAQLTNRTVLFLGNNKLTPLPTEIAQLINLTRLDLSRNQLTSLPPEIAQLTNLIKLYLSRNQLTSLPTDIVQLTDLTTLDLSSNQLKSLPTEIAQLTNLTELAIESNPLESPPPEVVKNGTAAIIEFLKGIVEVKIERFIAKLLLVGEGGVGKSSILRNLRGEEFDHNLKTTHGIDVREYQIPHQDQKDVTIILNTWDFGGHSRFIMPPTSSSLPCVLFILLFGALDWVWNRDVLSSGWTPLNR